MSSNNNDREDTATYKVVINHEDQYSIWPADRDNPRGWQDAGKVGRKTECLEYIKAVWTDLRPMSLRKRMEEIAQMGSAHVKFTDTGVGTEVRIR